MDVVCFCFDLYFLVTNHVKHFCVLIGHLYILLEKKNMFIILCLSLKWMFAILLLGFVFYMLGIQVPLSIHLMPVFFLPSVDVYLGKNTLKLDRVQFIHILSFTCHLSVTPKKSWPNRGHDNLALCFF